MTRLKNVLFQARKISLGLLSLFLSWRLKFKTRVRLPDILIVDAAAKALIKQPQVEYSQTKIDNYKQSTKEVILWHGSGFFQYRGEDVVSVFDGMVSNGGIKPFQDVFPFKKIEDYKDGELISISLARNRMYARIYADMHQYKGVNLGLRFGTPTFWSMYFGVATVLKALVEGRLWTPKRRQDAIGKVRERSHKLWATKVHSKPSKSWTKFFTEGSDIENNFPILIGLKDSSFKKHKVAKAVGLHEVRASEMIKFEQFSHIEVPEEHVDDMKHKLKSKYGHVSIFPMEIGELVASHSEFSKLVS